jgi:hypothetical protein
MAPLIPKSNKTKNKKGVQTPPMLRLCDGVLIHEKQQNKNIKRGGAEAPCLSILGDGAQVHPKTTKKTGEPNCAKTWQWRPPTPKNNKTKRKKKKELLSKLGDGIHLRLGKKKPNKEEERELKLVFFFPKTWPWCQRSNKKKEKKGGASSFFAKSLQWRLRSRKRNKRK